MLYIFLIITTNFCLAQERVWLDNGNPVTAKITRVVDNRLEWVASDGIPRIYHRKRFLVAFNAQGNFIVITDLENNPKKAQEQMEELYALPPRQVEFDLILKTVPLTVIPGVISYESDEVLNYQTPGGDPASINKEQVGAVIYRDGKHEILRDVIDVAPLLALAHDNIRQAEAEYKIKESEPEPKPKVEELMAKTEPKEKEVATPPGPAHPFLSAEEYKEYSEKGIARVHQFANYLQVIADKSQSLSDRNQAVNQAAQLFEPSATVSVSGSRGVSRYPVREYLNRVKLLPYSRINVTWTEVRYIEELKQEADGNYYGTITGQQVFEGYGRDGKSIAYGDVTKKNIKVKLESYEKVIDGRATTNWGVLLGNIGLEAERD
ncbi:hypothetical protein [Persicitalea jodogahamensis]|uniref:hypothetical protein n=1 Tax=Persicitalea jodogahamensis TaxID=402147 RepID=UPI00366E99FC